MAIYVDQVTALRPGSVTFVKSFIATDGGISATYRGNGKGKKKETFVILILGNHTDGDPPFHPDQALESMGYFLDEKRKRPAHPNSPVIPNVPVALDVQRAEPSNGKKKKGT